MPPAAAGSQCRMQTLNPGLSTGPKSSPKISLEGGNFIFQAGLGAQESFHRWWHPGGAPNRPVGGEGSTMLAASSTVASPAARPLRAPNLLYRRPSPPEQKFLQERHLPRVRPHGRADHGLRLQGSYAGTSPHLRWVAEAEPSWVRSGVWRAPGLRLTTWRGSEGSPDELLPAWGWGLPLSLPLSLPLFSAWGCCSWGVEPGSDRARSSQLTLVAVGPGSAAAPQRLARRSRAGWSPVPATSKSCWFVGPCGVLGAVRMCGSSANLWHLPAWLL